MLASLRAVAPAGEATSASSWLPTYISQSFVLPQENETISKSQPAVEAPSFFSGLMKSMVDVVDDEYMREEAIATIKAEKEEAAALKAREEAAALKLEMEHDRSIVVPPDDTPPLLGLVDTFYGALASSAKAMEEEMKRMDEEAKESAKIAKAEGYEETELPEVVEALFTPFTSNPEDDGEPRPGLLESVVTSIQGHIENSAKYFEEEAKRMEEEAKFSEIEAQEEMEEEIRRSTASPRTISRRWTDFIDMDALNQFTMDPGYPEDSKEEGDVESVKGPAPKPEVSLAPLSKLLGGVKFAFQKIKSLLF